eukprot:gnl/Spiro4/6340_TR3268_c0_g1_i1.p2 gnl/Spiro4/6340_TR3268_c0_g1~~gnl/Spiro4/6340_TR3268_c0_g1_i1.p2  ORF type:complete len:260 (+),score=135.44 gnl/Spiro4/6340_TR3268_c0_g1_i1:52-831(+)
MGRAQLKKEGKKKPHTRHAKELVPGVNRVGRSRSAHQTHRWKYMEKAKKAAAEKKEQKAVVKLEKPAASYITPAASADKKAKARPATEPRWYAADDAKKPVPSRKANHRATALRKSITPGTVLIILAGRFQGKRVVFLKQLPSGLLLVTGPYKYNGVPLRRINQAYVISTSTKVDVSSVDVKNISDAFFAKAKKADDKKAAFLDNKEKKKNEIAAARKTEQKRVDTALLAVVNKTPLLKQYLKAKFSLNKGQYPHQLKF